jgi:3-methylcrotonyl-CoA carboxylase alpha subunit
MMMKPFRKILIANRGEIVLRIMRSAKQLGIATACIFSEEDHHSLWTEPSGEAWSLGNGSIAETYLNSDLIISLAQKAGADAIHPGYGFLSENYRLALACNTHNITFIGPSPEVLILTSDKPAAQRTVKNLGIRTIETVTGTLPELQAMEHSFSYPLMIKAAFGGGGKGMRLVHNPAQFKTALSTASSEALQYFGDGRIYLEQYLNNARHIEVQILGDHHGNLVHLYDRECSVQRRHQKVIEEAPALIDDRTRKEITDAALLIAQKINYAQAGTVEFLLDEQGYPFFLEINPRIQVEHGITEMITGVDIVREQIMIAAGEPLSLTMDAIKVTGHAIEARVYAEDTGDNFMPSPGTIHYFAPPNIEGIRIDAAVDHGSCISGKYDPMIAKIMAHAPTRDEAIAKLYEAIGKFIITGIKHNLHMLECLLDDEDFRLNKVTTQFLNNKIHSYNTLLAHQRTTFAMLAKIAAAALILNDNRKDLNASPWNNGYWRNVQQLRFHLNGTLVELEYQQSGKSIVCYQQHDLFQAQDVCIHEFNVEFIFNNQPWNMYYVPEKQGIILLSLGNIDFIVERFICRTDAFASPDTVVNHSSGDTVLSPQPGIVLEVRVSEGQLVNLGDNLLTIESMKLENTLLASQPGLIKRINIKAGDKVKKNEPLMVLQRTDNH